MGRVLFASRQNAPKSINSQALTASDGANGLNPPPADFPAPALEPSGSHVERSKVAGGGGRKKHLLARKAARFLVV